MAVSRLRPVQFNFQMAWRDEIVPLFKTPEIVQELKPLEAIYQDYIEMMVEGLEKEEADELTILETLTFMVRKKDLHWLTEKFGSHDLSGLVMAIAKKIRPGTWEFLDHDELELSIITNPERSLVFDIKNFNRLSAAGSLALVGDLKFVNDPRGAAEAQAFRNERRERLFADCENLRRDLERFSEDNGEVIPLKT